MRFEDLRVWQVSRELNKRVMRLVGNPGFKGKRYLSDQLERASNTCMTNISEAFANRTFAQVKSGFSISIASAAEVQSLLYACADARLISQVEFAELYDLADLVQKLGKAFVKAGRHLDVARA